MTWRTRNARVRAGRIVAAALAALAWGACGRPPELTPGVAVEGRLEPGESVSYRIEAGAGEYLRVAVEPIGAEVHGGLDAVILDPRGSALIEAPGIGEAIGGTLAWVTASEGQHRLELTDPGSPEGLDYRLILEERRAARAEDGDRAAAELARAEAVRSFGKGDLTAAGKALERQLEHWQRVEGAAAATTETLLDLVEVERRSDPERALARCEEAIRVSTEAGLGSWRVEAFNEKGKLLRARRDCAGSLDAYTHARAAALGGGDLSAAGVAAYNMGRLQLDCASGREAKAAFLEAIDLGHRAGDVGLQAVGHRDLAVLARASFDLSAAREHLDLAWALVEELKDSEDPADLEATADVLYERANLQRALGRLGDAQELFRRSLDLNQKLGRDGLSLRVLLSLGGLALDLRRPEDAREFYRQALERAHVLNDLQTLADAQHGLGAVEERSREEARAEELYRQSLTTAEELGPGRTRAFRVAAAKSRLGSLLLNQNRPAEALPYLVEALALQQEAGDPRAEAATRRSLAAAFALNGDGEAAAGMFDDALATGRELGDPISIAWTLYSRASTLAGTDPGRARRVLEQAIETLEQVRTELRVDALRADFSDGPRRIYELYLDLLMAAGEYREAFLASERGRSRALLDLLAEARIDLHAGVEPSVREEARALEERMSWLRNELGEAVATGADQERTAALSQLLVEAEKDWWRVEAAIREASPRYRELRAPTAIEIGELQESMPPGRALLEYWLGRERAYVFVVTRGSFSAVSLGETPQLVAQVAALRAAIVGLQPPDRLAPPSHRLYLELVEPALALTAGADELIIVPDGPLHFLPFEALVTASAAPGVAFGDLSYLGNRAVISYAPSATVLATLGTPRADPAAAGSPAAAPLHLVALADPRHDRPVTLDCDPARLDGAPVARGLRARSLEPLEASREEAVAITRRYGDRARVYQGAEATEARVKHSAELASAEMLHFAVHGVICETLPERSGLVLALDDDPTEDGLLQVREIFGLRLAAEIVVLSACDSGTGKLVSGEGVMGLARAFFYAGVPTTVVSLWPVSDRSTAELMESFYEHLDAGDDTAQALQKARRGLIEAGGRHAAPFYWAPFVVLGSQ